MSGVLHTLATVEFWTAAMLAATPLLLAMLGALVCGRAGIVHLGCEGLFIVGALTGYWATLAYGSPHMGVLAALVVGGAIGLAHGVLISPLGLPQATTGIAVTVLVAGVAQFLLALHIPANSALPSSALFMPIALPAVPDLAALGNTATTALRRTVDLLRVPLPVYAAALLALLAAYVLNRTPVGFAIRACGESPDSIATQGRSVHRIRVGANIAGSALMALGGAVLVLAGTGKLAFGPLDGRGFVALALAMAVRWRPGWALVAALGFGVVDASQTNLAQGGARPALLAFTPLILAIVVLAATSPHIRWPQLHLRWKFWAPRDQDT